MAIYSRSVLPERMGRICELTRSLAQAQGVDLRHFFKHRIADVYCKPLVLAKGASPRELNRLDSKI